MSWKLHEWNNYYAENQNLPVMTNAEIKKAKKYLRENNYPKPEDCPSAECLEYRPSCKLGICKIAVKMCGDF